MATQATSGRGAMIDRPTARQVTDKTKETIGQVADTTRQQADHQRERLAGGISKVADSLRQTGEVLGEHDQDMVGNYAQKAATQVERVAGYVRERSIDEIVGDVEDFARREPALMLGGAFALGFLAARLLKSGGRSPRQPSYQAMNYRPASSSGRVSNGS